MGVASGFGHAPTNPPVPDLKSPQQCCSLFEDQPVHQLIVKNHNLQVRKNPNIFNSFIFGNIVFYRPQHPVLKPIFLEMFQKRELN